jgi:hypothetical protein
MAVLRRRGGTSYRYSNRIEDFAPMEDHFDTSPAFNKIIKGLLLSDSMLYSEQVGRSNDLSGLRRLAVGRRLMLTSRCALGLVPVRAKDGDRIWFFDGCDSPFVIRKEGDSACVIVGQARKPYLTSVRTMITCSWL